MQAEQVEADLPSPPKEVVGGKDAFARQRSSSPWTFSVRSNHGSGFSTPNAGSFRGAPRSSSGFAARATQESALLQAVKKQLENFQEKVSAEIRKIQSQNDKVMEATFSRLDEKLTAYEHFQPEIERRVSGLTGNFQGLSEESSRQIRRLDSMDERLLEFKRHLDQEFRQKFSGVSELQQQINKFNSTSKVMYVHLEDMQKSQNSRLERLEEQCNASVDVHTAVVGLCNRMDTIEVQYQDVSAVPNQIRGQTESREQLEDASALLKVLERRMSDMSAKINESEEETSLLHADSKSHEEQLKSLRSLLDAREEKFRTFMDKDRERMNVEAKLEQIKRRFEEDSLQSQEKIETTMTRLASQEQALEQMRDRLIGSIGFGSSATEIPPLELTDANGGSDNWVDQLASTETRLHKVEETLEELRLRSESDGDLGDKVNTLVKHLGELVPKVTQMDALTVKVENMNTIEMDIEALKTLVAESAVKEVSATQQISAVLETLQMMELQLKQTSDKEEVANMMTSVMQKIDAQSSLVEGLARVDEIMREIDMLKEGSTKCSSKLEQYENLRLEIGSDIQTFKHESCKVVDDLKEEVKGLKSHVTKSQIEELVEASVIRLREEVQREVSGGIQNRHSQKNSVVGSTDIPLLADEEEVLLEQRLLERIDELCRQIAAVENAVGKCVSITPSDKHPG